MSYRTLAQTTPVTHNGLFLVTNIVQKDLNSPDPRSALLFLANVSSTVIHESVITSLIALLVNSKADIRKKAMIALHTSHKLGCVALDTIAEHVRTALDDEEISIVITAVSFLIECVSLEARKCLVFAPVCLNLLKKTSNVMLQNRLVRFMELLSQIEPRIYSKLETVLVSHTSQNNLAVVRYASSMALFSHYHHTNQNCHETMRSGFDVMGEFLEGSDHNLRFCGLDILEKAFVSLLQTSDYNASTAKELAATKFVQVR